MPVLGMRGTGSFASPDDRPKDYRDSILFLFPNGDAPLTALLTKLKKESTSDPEFRWAQKELATRRVTVNGAQTAGDTTIEVNSSLAKIFRAGDVLLNERTLEQLWVASDPTLATEIIVTRGKGGTTAAAMVDADGLICVGRAYQEGADVPTAVSFDPAWVFNYTQIFRTPTNITRTAKNSRMRFGTPTKEMKREALEMHAGDMEMAYLFGRREEDVSGSQPKRTTGGLLQFATTNVFDAGGTLSESEWDGYMKDIFAYGSTEKLMLAGSTVMMVLAQLAKAKGQINLTPTKEGTYGMKLVEYITPHGTLYLKSHPRLSNNATFTSWGFVIDTKFLKYRYIAGSDTDYKMNRQGPGVDGQIDEWITECGLEFGHEKAHGILKNITSFAP